MRPALLALLLALLPSLLFAADPPAATAPLFDDNGTPLTIAQFVEKYIPADMPEGLGRKEVQAALEDAGANWVNFVSVFPYLTGQTVSEPEKSQRIGAAAWLAINAPHLDRLELTSHLLTAQIEVQCMWASVIGFDLDSDLFRRYLLNYRIDDEPVTDWIGTIYDGLYRTTLEHWPIPDAKPENRASEMERALNSLPAFTVIERGYFGNLSDPVSILQSHAGTKKELAILTCAVLRSYGFPTRFVRENRRGESWVEVYSGDPKTYDAQAWTPVYPTAPDKTGEVAYATELCGGRICVVTAGDAFGREQVTERYTSIGSIGPSFYTKDPISGDHIDQSEFSGWAITAWNDSTGSFVPLDDLEFPSSDKDYPLDENGDNTSDWYSLGPGNYRLEYGLRYPGGVSHVKIQGFTVTADMSATMSVNIDPPADLPLTALVEREIGDFPESNRLMKRGRYVFLVGDGGEPSLRAYELLKPLESRSSVFFQHWRMVGAAEEERAFVKDVLKVDLEKDALPVVIVVVDGRTTMYLRGYNLNVAQWVERALGVSSGE